ncbi:MAG: alpha/beta hydrolase [Hyphomicrobiaceae bacterium]
MNGWLVLALAACASGGIADLSPPTVAERPRLSAPPGAAETVPAPSAADARTGSFAWVPGEWSVEIVVPPKPIPATRPIRPPPPRVARRPARAGAGTRLVALDAAPFPFDGAVPGRSESFFNISAEGRRGRRTPSGRVYWADETYSDRRSLIHVPRGFDLARPAMLVLFFHGHGAKLERDIWHRQHLPQQIDLSGMNAVLAAPQFAVDARDSSIGRFWQKGAMKRYLAEVAGHLARLYGDPAAAAQFAELPILVVGYSGGFMASAFALGQPGVSERVAGVVLLDGVYGHVGTFAEWIRHSPQSFLVSGYGRFTQKGNDALRAEAERHGLAPVDRMPERLGRGEVALIRADARHHDYVTLAWAPNPIADVLRRVDGLATRRGAPARVATTRR